MRFEEETWFDGKPGGAPVHFRAWRPEAPTAVLCIVHGMGEHIGRYAPHAARFAAAGVAVYGLDHIGHGLSGGVRGHTPRYDGLLDGVDALLAEARGREGAAVPLAVWGHSMGGNILLARALRGPLDAAALVATAPFLQLPKDPPAFQIALGRLIDRVLPTLTQPTRLDPTLISRDPDQVQRYIDDPLVHDRISARWFLGAQAAAETILARAGEFPLPLLLMHGAGDGIVSVEGSRLFAERAGPRCRYREFPKAYHELHNDFGKDEVFAEMRGFLAGYGVAAAE